MAQVIYSDQALSDFERLSDFLLRTDPDLAITAVAAIQEGIAILERHPLIGRPVEHALREVVISRGKTGCVALYAYLENRDLVTTRSTRQATWRWREMPVNESRSVASPRTPHA